MTMQKRACAGICLLTAIVCLLAACATTQARKAETSGFLGDYSQLQKGGEDEALLRYVAPDADIKAYDSILMDPVQLYVVDKDSLKGVSKQELESLVNYAAVAIRERLGRDYKLVNRPGKRVMRLRVAITEAESSCVPLDVMSTLLPPALAVSTLKQMITGTPAFVGKAGVEAEMLDSQTDRRLFAAVDRRAGGKITGEFDKANQWRAVQSSIDYWAERLGARLAQERAR